MPIDARATRNDFTLGLLAALAAALVGSGWQLASRHGVTTTLGPLELAALRYGIPCLALSPLWLPWLRTGLRPPGLAPARLALLVLGGGLPFGALALAGLQWAPAAHLGVFMAGSMPLFTALGARLVHGEAVGGRRAFGLALVLAGILAFGLGVSGGRAPAGAWRGDALFLLAALLWAVYSLAFRRSALTPWQGAALVNAWSALLLLPLIAAWGVPRLWLAPAGDVAWQALGQGVAAGMLGLVTYGAAIRRLGAARASLSAALVPLFTSAGAAWLLAEPFTGATACAIALVTPGVALASGLEPARRPRG